jgi:hypothetical protein
MFIFLQAPEVAEGTVPPSIGAASCEVLVSCIDKSNLISSDWPTRNQYDPQTRDGSIPETVHHPCNSSPGKQSHLFEPLLRSVNIIVPIGKSSQ